MPITVGVINPAETEKATVQVPDDVPLAALTQALIDAMGLPSRGQDGHRLRYHLSAREPNGTIERLDDNLSLQENRITDDQDLQLTVEMVAGSPPSRATDEQSSSI